MIISVLKLEISWSNDGLRQAVIMSGSVVLKTAKLKDRIKKNKISHFVANFVFKSLLVLYL